ncbi:MAG: rhodanese-like domain-containing protein [Desulfobacterales bacterium]
MSIYKHTKHMVFIMVVLLTTPMPSAAAETAAAHRIPDELIKNSPVRSDLSLAVTADEILNRTKSRGMILVDIRSPKDFERLRIPGSINVALHAVKTKFYLKSQPFVLVAAGFVWRDLEAECKRLCKGGFKPSILFGGLVAWQDQGGPLEGDLLALNEMRLISPADFYREKNLSRWLVVDGSQKRTAESRRLFPQALHAPFKKKSTIVEFCEHLSGSIPNGKKVYRTVLLFTQTGEHYASIEKICRKGDFDIFFLDGGLQDYGQYADQLVLYRQSKKNKIKRIGSCRTCERSVQENAE